MPLIHIESPQPGARLILWKITESEEELTSLVLTGERSDFIPPAIIKSKKRRLEWLATRNAFLQTNNDKAFNIAYNENGKPFPLNNKSHLSISHAWPMVCIMEHESIAVGVDIECITDRIIKIAEKFINKQERNWLSTPDNLNELYLIWAAKEALFKMKGVTGVDFRKDLTLSETNIQQEGVTTILYNKDGAAERFNIYYRFLDGMILVYTIAFPL